MASPVTGVGVVAVPSTDFDDPDGNALMLHHRYAPHEPSRRDS